MPYAYFSMRDISDDDLIDEYERRCLYDSIREEYVNEAYEELDKVQNTLYDVISEVERRHSEEHTGPLLLCMDRMCDLAARLGLN